MSDEANLMPEHRRRIRRGVDELRVEMGDVKLRLTSRDGHLAQSRPNLALQSGRTDRVEERPGRIERRLDLIEA